MQQKKIGLYPKFIVNRTDGRDQPGGDRHGASYFVLDMTHDKFAPSALLAYANACATDYPQLHQDLIKNVLASVEIERDQYGTWSHPALPRTDDESFDIRAWLKKYGYESATEWMEHDAPQEQVDAYFSGGHFSNWNPTPPIENGWFLVLITDTEDGPVAVFARKAQA
ncbi:hypothetical protein [Aquitalea aquatilis]|uniref:hypothetical protein n=1 Tax=Aquitalea aquatilis TaxID=1537400 RepID=UPI0010BDFFC3|nr:hypothetical protein [Aquitalea aquatilis]